MLYCESEYGRRGIEFRFEGLFLVVVLVVVVLERRGLFIVRGRIHPAPHAG